MRREPARRRVPPGVPQLPFPGARFPWGLALGAFAAASILLSAVLGVAGSAAPSIVLAVLGVGLATAGAVAWRANSGAREGRTGVAVPSPFDQVDLPKGSVPRRSSPTRTGDDGADLDLSSIPDFRTRRGVAAVPVSPPPATADKPARAVPVPVGVEEAVREFAAAGGAVAAAVLMRRGRRLVAVAAAGNWAAARAGRVEGPGTALSTSPDAGSDAPEFPIDDTLAESLASSARALPLERWKEIGDVPGGMLPVVALSDQGAAVVVASSHLRQFLALWVASARDGSRRYTDHDINAFEAVARERTSLLVPAMQDG